MTETTPVPDEGVQIVYVREANRAALPKHLRETPGPMFTVHDPNGTCLAITQGRDAAFALAKRNDLNPVSVH